MPTSFAAQDTRPTGASEGQGFKADIQLDMTTNTYTADVVERSQQLTRGWEAFQSRRVEKGTFELRSAKLGNDIVFQPREVQLSCCGCNPPGNEYCGCLDKLKSVTVPDEWKEYTCNDTGNVLQAFPLPLSGRPFATYRNASARDIKATA